MLTQATDEFVVSHGLTKGAMHLIDEARARELYDAMGAAIEISGGSAANTIVGVASFGGRGQYIGKVRDDQLGEVFRHDLRATGVGYEILPAGTGPATGRCLILVTPDAQRTLNTYLGASVHLGPEDIDPQAIARSRILYLEGYLFDPPRAQEAFRVAARHAHASGGQVALTLSDPFCVGRHRAAFRELVEHHIDILLANESEICALYETDDFDIAAQQVRRHCSVAALTRSAKGSVIVSRDEIHVVSAAPVAQVVDTTGAGDLFASGFLLGLSRGLPLPICGRLGSIAAAEVISHVGARPQVSLAKLAGGLLP